MFSSFILLNSAPSILSNLWSACPPPPFSFFLKKTPSSLKTKIYLSVTSLINPMHNLQSYKDQVHSLSLMRKCSKIAFTGSPLDSYFYTLNRMFFQQVLINCAIDECCPCVPFIHSSFPMGDHIEVTILAQVSFFVFGLY